MSTCVPGHLRGGMRRVIAGARQNERMLQPNVLVEVRREVEWCDARAELSGVRVCMFVLA